MDRTPISLSDEVINVFVDLFEEVRDKQFAIGDLLNQVIAKTGAAKSEVINYLAGILNVSASTLYDYSRVAEIWTEEYRNEFRALDWTVYRNTDPSDPIDRQLLELCIDEGWNANRLKREKYPDSEECLTNSLLSLVNRLKSSSFPRMRELGEIIEAILEAEKAAVPEREKEEAR